MRRTMLLLLFALIAGLLAACGRFDVQVVEPTREPGQEVGDLGATPAVARTTAATSFPDSEPSLATRTPAVTPAEKESPTPEQTDQPVPQRNGNDDDGDAVSDEPSGPPADDCEVRTDWPVYAVKGGDTLFRIASAAGATVNELVQANCLENPDRLFSGQRLRVPRLPPNPPTPTPTVQPEQWQRHDDDLYQVSFDYPAAWRDVSEGTTIRFAGDDGWVQLQAATSPHDVDAVAAEQANHQLLPYGSAPVVQNFSLPDGRPARLILPSADQPASLDGQHLIVAPYAEPIVIGQVAFNYLMLAADGDHIRDIGGTLALPPPTGNIVIDEFDVSAQDLPGGGKRLTFRWQASGANRGTITSGSHRRFIPWWPVESSGELIVDLASTVYPDPTMTLSVVNDVSGQSAVATAVVPWACEYDYFFQPPPDACPLDAALVVDGAYQPFERGFMIWLPRPDLAQPSIYVFTDDGRVLLYPDTWTADDPDNDLDETPPEGLFEPVGGFAKVWREHPNVRSDLGWGTAKEFLYKVSYQAERRESIPSITYLTRPDGTFVRLMETLWQVYVPGQDQPGQGGVAP